MCSPDEQRCVAVCGGVWRCVAVCRWVTHLAPDEEGSVAPRGVDDSDGEDCDGRRSRDEAARGQREEPQQRRCAARAPVTSSNAHVARLARPAVLAAEACGSTASTRGSTAAAVTESGRLRVHHTAVGRRGDHEHLDPARLRPHSKSAGRRLRAACAAERFRAKSRPEGRGESNQRFQSLASALRRFQFRAHLNAPCRPAELD